jgi:dTDP-glucose 4,6-dehydratase
MKTYLVTGAAGFIGANYIKYILAKHEDIKVVILDALTYAGNLGTIAKDVDNERCFFIKGNICDRELADRLFSEYKFDYIVNFAAESHVDRSIENPQLLLNKFSYKMLLKIGYKFRKVFLIRQTITCLILLLPGRKSFRCRC